MQQLKTRILKAAPDAFVDLHELYGQRMLRYLNSRVGSTDALDVMQEVFVRLFRHHRKLGKAKNLEAFVFLTVRNEASRWAARNKKHSHNRKPMIEKTTRDTDRMETVELARKLLTHVSDESREIVELKIYSGLTFATISDILKIPLATVATKYRRAIQKMQNHLEPAESKLPEPTET